MSEEVFELGARSSSTRADVLQRLGAPPPKQQRKPFRIAMGMANARARRAKAEAELAKTSGVVVPRKKHEVVAKRARDANDVGLGIPRGPVLLAGRGKGVGRRRTVR